MQVQNLAIFAPDAARHAVGVANPLQELNENIARIVATG